MRLVFISDTHNLHRNYGRMPFGDVFAGDMLIHCGDITTHGSEAEVEIFLNWFERQPHRYKLWIAGNHDRCLENIDVQSRWGRANIIYLQDSSVTINGLNFYGSPYTPDHHDFAFQLHDKAVERWAEIPTNTDVLITHGPPFGILDNGHGLESAGCRTLLNEIANRIHPKVHAFGHIHEGYGRVERDNTTFINAAVHQWLWKQDRRRNPQTIDL